MRAKQAGRCQPQVITSPTLDRPQLPYSCCCHCLNQLLALQTLARCEYQTQSEPGCISTSKSDFKGS